MEILNFAEMRNHDGVLELLSTSDLNSVSENGMTLMMHAEDNNWNDVIEYLLSSEKCKFYGNIGFNKIEILEHISKGAYGVVKKVKHILSEKKFALKIYADKKVELQDFHRDYIFMRILNGLSTPNIYGLISDSQKVCILMENYETTLYNKSLENYNMIKENIGLIMENCLKCLNHIHCMGIIHCDIKGSNIVINSPEDLKIIDFSLSSFAGIGPEKQIVNSYVSTVNVMSYDCFRTLNIGNNIGIPNRKTYNTDVYSLGVTILSILFKDFQSKFIYMGEKIYKIEDNKYRVLHDVYDNFLSENPRFKDLICGMIHWNSKERFNAKDCLNHPYFNRVISRNFIFNNITDLNVKYLSENNVEFNLMNYFKNYTSDEIKNCNYELSYLEEIISNYSNKIIKPGGRIVKRKTKAIMIQLLWDLKALDLNIIYNCFYLVLKNSENRNDKELITETKVIGTILKHIFSSYEDELSNTSNIILEYQKVLDFKFTRISDLIPVSYYIKYCVVELQKRNYEVEKILNAEKKVTIYFLIWMLECLDEKILENVIKGYFNYCFKDEDIPFPNIRIYQPYLNIIYNYGSDISRLLVNLGEELVSYQIINEEEIGPVIAIHGRYL